MADPVASGSRSAANSEQLSSVPAPVTLEPVIVPKSIFFTQGELDAIQNALAAHANLTNSDFLSVLTANGDNAKPEKFIYPQFFLSSIVYHGPSDWAVWINNHKFTAENNLISELHIVALNSEIAEIEWKPPSLKNYNRLASGSVNVDQVNGVIRFSLRPNQTFSSYAMRVVEGRIEPISSDNAAAQPVANAVKSAATENSPAGQGMPGLMNRYKNLNQEKLP